jgi:tetratricopeptide (TPR) repeat protein
MDYLAALENAPDGYTRGLYEEEAKRVSEMQKGVLAISSREEPYDVFICYKETTDGGSRTKDSALAQDVYYQLVKEGCRVFFSRITLEDKLGREYEPYIFAALNSAKVMLVIGTAPAHFGAVWVRNEWSRFLALMKKDRGKLLIPCYRDMDAYDLPPELSMLQSQDMSKIGFMQDLIRGVKKVLGDGSHSIIAAPASSPVSTKPSGAGALLERAFIVLEDEEWQKADELLEQVLNLDPKNPWAYLGKLLVKLELPSADDLPAKAVAQRTKSLSEYKDYQKALRFADAECRVVLEGYEKARQELVLEKRYQAAVTRMKFAMSAADFKQVADSFAALSGYSDADALAKKCLAMEVKCIAETEVEERREREEKEMERSEQRYQDAVVTINSNDTKNSSDTIIKFKMPTTTPLSLAEHKKEKKRLDDIKIESKHGLNFIVICPLLFFGSLWFGNSWLDSLLFWILGCCICLIVMGAFHKRAWSIWIPAIIILLISWQCGSMEQPETPDPPPVEAVETPSGDGGGVAKENKELGPGYRTSPPP